MGSSFGQLFRIATFGESHGPGVGVVVDGCPPKLALRRDEIQAELDRRRPGQSKLTSRRDEADQVEILSGVAGELTLGIGLGHEASWRNRRYRAPWDAMQGNRI